CTRATVTRTVTRRAKSVTGTVIATSQNGRYRHAAADLMPSTMSLAAWAGDFWPAITALQFWATTSCWAISAPPLGGYSVPRVLTSVAYAASSGSLVTSDTVARSDR